MAAHPVANAVELLRSDDFRSYLLAVNAYTARTVASEPAATQDHTVRFALAVKVLKNPTYGLDRLISVAATDPAIASLGTRVGDGNDISESVLISEVASLWTVMAQLDAAG